MKTKCGPIEVLLFRTGLPKQDAGQESNFSQVL